ncbi:AAA family ATPase (plasmid) [Streptomyces sp. NBC_00984]|uniref:AAA family ATPase n=1 Tax=Streptomyces sp. NBC_00984 TaxID=2903700 RepID=UPI002F9171DD|nr:AAA family ATPase [Streptomyces sp. NBC_00984]
MPARPTQDESSLAQFLRMGPRPDRTRHEGWQQWRLTRDAFIPAPRLSLREYDALSPRRKGLHDMHRTASHVNMRLQETPMSTKVADLMLGRLQNNAVRFAPSTLDGLMLNGGGFQGKTETACRAAAAFEDMWREVYRQLLPGSMPGTRDLFVPVAYCRLPVRATPKALCKNILDVYGNPHPGTLDDLVRAVRDSIRDHNTTALLIDDVTRLRLHRQDDQDTLDLIRELMDLNVTLVLIGVDIPKSGLLRGAYVDARTNQYVLPDIRRGKSHNEAADTQTDRRFDLVDLDPFDYTTPIGIAAFLDHPTGIEDQLRLFRATAGMLTSGSMPEYLFRRSRGIVGLLRRLIEAGCTGAIASGEERLSLELLRSTPIRLGNLDDLDAETGEVPDIPQDVPPPATSAKKSAGRPRNTVFDDRGERPAADG